MFMGATEEQMKLLDENHVDHISYMLLLYSIAFLLYLCTSSYHHSPYPAPPLTHLSHQS